MSEENTGPDGDTSANSDASASGNEWFTGLDEDTQTYATGKGWDKDPAAAITSYREFEKFRGIPLDQIAQLPNADTNDETRERLMGDIYNRLGRPENAEGYEIKLPEGATMDDNRLKVMREVAHKEGLSPKQLNALAEADAGFMAGLRSDGEAATKESAAVAEADLRKEWGAGYDKNVASVDAAAREFGMEEGELLALRTAMGPAKAMIFMANVGKRLGEDGFEGGRDEVTGFGSMTPAEASNEIQKLNLNPEFMKKYMGGDKDALARMNNLHALKAGGG